MCICVGHSYNQVAHVVISPEICSQQPFEFKPRTPNENIEQITQGVSPFPLIMTEHNYIHKIKKN